MNTLAVVNEHKSANVEAYQALEKVIVGGDLSQLDPEQSIAYYNGYCESLGLNPLTRPFEYLTLQGKKVLYARKDCAEQLRKVHKVSLGEPTINFKNNICMVSIAARLPDGRTDSDIGVVDISKDRINGVMKAVTKAKRRVTLSICGLGILDESELDTITPEPVTDYTQKGRDLWKAISKSDSIEALQSHDPALRELESAKFDNTPKIRKHYADRMRELAKPAAEDSATIKQWKADLSEESLSADDKRKFVEADDKLSEGEKEVLFKWLESEQD